MKFTIWDSLTTEKKTRKKGVWVAMEVLQEDRWLSSIPGGGLEQTM